MLQSFVYVLYLLIVFLFVGCKTTSQFVPWEGRNIKDATAQYGLPIDKHKGQDSSNEIVTYLEVRSTELPGVIDHSDPMQASGARVPSKQEFFYDCFHRFTIDDKGTIVKYEEAEELCKK